MSIKIDFICLLTQINGRGCSHTLDEINVHGNNVAMQKETLFTQTRSILENINLVGGALMGINFYWFILSLPIVTIPPAIAALYATTRRVIDDERADWEMFWGSFRQHFWMSWRWGGITLASYLLLLINLRFYWLMEAQWASFAFLAFLMLTILWTIIQLHFFPVLFAQVEPSIKLAFRNSAILAFQRPLNAIWLLTLTLFYAIVSTTIPILWPIISGGMCALIGTHIVRLSLKQSRTIE